MLDLGVVRNETERVKERVRARNLDERYVDEALQADDQRKLILQELEQLRRERNQISEQIGRWMGEAKKAEKSGDTARWQTLQTEIEVAKDRPRQMAERITLLEEQLRTVEEALRTAMLWIPNMPHHSAPVGPDESYNEIGEPQGVSEPSFTFTPKPHWELGVERDWIDFDRGVKLSGSRFYLLKGWGARLQRAVIQFMLDSHTQQHGFTEIYPPFMVRSVCFEGAGQLPKFFDNIYRDAEEDFMLLGTAEIALTNVHRDEILEEAQLPLKYVSYTPCFRREKMSAGKDVRGIKRGHQFDKVEMYQYVHPSQSYAVLEEMRQYAADICDALGFRYRILTLATGDIGFGMAKTYDIEVWASGCREWLEVSSISNAESYQARRANIRCRPTDGGKLFYPHTLNASGLALPRVMIAILENNQQEDGSVVIPPVLRPYLGGAEVMR